MATIVNLTPHTLNIVFPSGEELIIAPSGTIARCKTTSVLIGDVNDIPVSRTQYGEVEGLPDPQEGVIYVTSALVANAAKDRDDVLIPNDSVRDEHGRIIGCRGLAHV